MRIKRLTLAIGLILLGAVAVVSVGGGILLALLARVTADWSSSYFAHVGAAALSWLVGTLVWLALLGPLLLAPERRPPPSR